MRAPLVVAAKELPISLLHHRVHVRVKVVRVQVATAKHSRIACRQTVERHPGHGPGPVKGRRNGMRVQEGRLVIRQHLAVRSVEHRPVRVGVWLVVGRGWLGRCKNSPMGHLLWIRFWECRLTLTHLVATPTRRAQLQHRLNQATRARVQLVLELGQHAHHLFNVLSQVLLQLISAELKANQPVSESN